MDKGSLRHFLAFDLGATSGRAILGTLGPGSFEMREIHRFPGAMTRRDGRLYWNTDELLGHLADAMKKAAAEGVRLTSIGIDTWGVDFGWVRDGKLLGWPRAYRDPYTEGVPAKVFELIPREDMYSKTGIQIMDFNSVFQLYAQSREADWSPVKGMKMVFMPDLLAFLLTGNRVCEYTDATTSGLLNQASRTFEKDFPEKMGIDPDLLPDEVVECGKVIGTLKPDIAKETGLGEVPVVAVAGHDTASAIAAVPAADERFAYLSSGTWSLMGIESPVPIMNAQSSRLNFTNEGGIEGTTRFLKNITGMWILEECRRLWKAEGRDYGYAELMQMAIDNGDFPGRINPDDPRFAHPENMAAEIRAAMVWPAGTGLEGTLSDGKIVSCIYHSLAERYAEVLEMLRGFAPFPIEKLHIIGGGSANSLLNQWTANALGIPVLAGPTEATAIGNLMVQAKAAGLVKDRWEMRRIIAENFPVTTYLPE